MQVQAHRPHKKEKWRCANCRAVRMKPVQNRDKKRESRWE